MQQGIVSGQSVYDMPPSFVYLGSAYWFGFPVSAWVTMAVFLVAALFLRYHRSGRAIYAIGGNLEAARAAGIKVDRIRIGVFCVAGVLAAVGGLMTAGQVLTVTANQGNNLIFTVFAAAVIGGIALEGGRGRMLGRSPASSCSALVNDVLVLRNTSTFWIDAVERRDHPDGARLGRVVALAPRLSGRSPKSGPALHRTVSSRNAGVQKKDCVGRGGAVVARLWRDLARRRCPRSC